MRERLLGSSGADLSRVYVIDDDGRLTDAVAAGVFHWDDLTEGQQWSMDNVLDAASASLSASVSVVDLVRAWQIVTDLGHLLGGPVQVLALCCPSCGGDDIAEDGSEDCDPGTVERWHQCHDCDATWTDTYVIGSRTVLTSGKSAPVVSTPGGVADWLDMAYEDRTDLGDEGRIYSGGWES